MNGWKKQVGLMTLMDVLCCAMAAGAEVTGISTFRLTYIMPEEWLDKAVFPVILDPTVVTYNVWCAIEDAWTSSVYPSGIPAQYKGNVDRLTKNSGSWGNCSCFYRFNNTRILPALDSSDYITYALFRAPTAQSGFPASSFDATAHEVTGNWTPGSLTHNNMPPYEEKALDYSHFTALEGGNNYHTFDITNLVRKWYTGTNNGVMLMSESKAILFDMDCIMMEN